VSAGWIVLLILVVALVIWELGFMPSSVDRHRAGSGRDSSGVEIKETPSTGPVSMNDIGISPWSLIWHRQVDAASSPCYLGPISMDRDHDLLVAWHARGDDTVFRILCDRHASLVGATCRRLGSPDVDEGGCDP
jgi:hypothetical protein